MNGIRVVIGVTGGIAAYKTAGMVSSLVQAGADVQVVMTDAARRFVGPVTFAALTGRPVATSSFDAGDYPLGAHIEIPRAADLLCVAPATADFIAKMALGIGDDLLSSIYLCFSGPVVIAPSMNRDMWSKPAVARNIEQVREDGVTVIEPEQGWLSCRDVGIGRMAGPERIIDILREIASRLPNRPGAG
jgi:phosphopantothenoylcysteine decarboxylase/phosphopantothenate--cysteine ligase